MDRNNSLNCHFLELWNSEEKAKEVLEEKVTDNKSNIEALIAKEDQEVFLL